MAIGTQNNIIVNALDRDNKLTAENSSAIDDNFGRAVAISADGNTIVVGAIFNDDNADNSGSAFIYKWDGINWNKTQLLASDGEANNYFGNSVSVSADGTRVIIGAHFDSEVASRAGAAYVYRWDGIDWSNESKITALDGAAFDYFGYSVSISATGERVVIGSYQDDDKGNQSGSAYIFTLNEEVWEQTVKISASDGAVNQFFGESVSISGNGNSIIIGAKYDTEHGNLSGAAYIYKWDGIDWNESKLAATDIAAGDNFGISVSISYNGDIALIGSHQDDNNGIDSGSAYIFNLRETIWEQTAILVATDGAAGDNFGKAVSISDDGNSAIIGAPLDDDEGDDSGSAFIFTLTDNSWNQTSKLLATESGILDGDINDYFGESVAISYDGNSVTVGSYLDDDEDENSGSIYLYDSPFVN